MFDGGECKQTSQSSCGSPTFSSADECKESCNQGHLIVITMACTELMQNSRRRLLTKYDDVI